jgi:hypothetical protein
MARASHGVRAREKESCGMPDAAAAASAGRSHGYTVQWPGVGRAPCGRWEHGGGERNWMATSCLTPGFTGMTRKPSDDRGRGRSLKATASYRSGDGEREALAGM